MAWTKNTAGFYTTEVDMQVITGGAANAESHYTDWFNYGDFAEPMFEYTLIVNPEHKVLGTVGIPGNNLSYKMWIQYRDINGATTGDIQTDLSATDWLDLTDDFNDGESHKWVPDIDAISIAVNATPTLKFAHEFRFHFQIGADTGQNYTPAVGDKFKVLITPHR
tara:strand:- start:495 stop:989 length:495 start_codon:yes stop_codon:yes gene_type:complete